MTDTEEILALLREQGEVLREQREVLHRQTETLQRLEGALAGRRESSPGPPPGGSFPLLVLFSRYPGFARDYEWLRAEGYLTETPDGLVWNKSKQSLAEYFGNQESPDQNHHWREVEAVFHIRNMRSSLSRNGDSFKKISSDYRELRARLRARLGEH
jgi:hypothetical protein